MGGVRRWGEDAVNPKAGLFDFFRGEAVVRCVGGGGADEVKEGGGRSNKDAVKKAIGFQGKGE